MPTLADLHQAHQEEHQAYVTELRFELQGQIRNHVIEWSRQFGDRFIIAAYSAVNGKWDDVRNDLRKGRVTLEDGIRLVDKMLEARLINQRMHGFYLGQFKAIAGMEA